MVDQRIISARVAVCDHCEREAATILVTAIDVGGQRIELRPFERLCRGCADATRGQAQAVPAIDGAAALSAEALHALAAIGAA
jgi:protein-arginine kinase activator protein McsA